MAVGFHHVSGPTLGEIRARLQGVQGATFRANLAQNLGEEARTQVANEFRQERDPYGNAWATLLYRNGKILQDTGRMRASVAVARQADGFTIEISATYAVFHQLGTKPHKKAERAAKQNARGRFVRMSKTGFLLRIRAHTNPGLPRRQMLPTADRGGLGPIWGDAFARVSRKMLDQQLGGG